MDYDSGFQPTDVYIKTNTIEKIVRDLSLGHEDHIRLGILTGENYDGKITINDLYVPNQESTKNITIVFPNTLFEAYREIQSEGLLPVGIVQYNAGHEPFETPLIQSSREFILEIGGPDISLVVNKRFELEVYPAHHKLHID
jgi:hypothetical protein